MKAVKLNFFDNEEVVCPKCGNTDTDNLFAIQGFGYTDMELPFALMCGKCCYIDVIDVEDDNGEVSLYFKKDKC